MLNGYLKVTAYWYLLAQWVLKGSWTLAMVWGEVEGIVRRLLASLATNSTNSTVYLFPQVNPEGGMRLANVGGGGWG